MCFSYLLCKSPKNISEAIYNWGRALLQLPAPLTSPIKDAGRKGPPIKLADRPEDLGVIILKNHVVGVSYTLGEEQRNRLPFSP